MTTTFEPDKFFESSLYLNPNEQDLLVTALNSNKTATSGTMPGNGTKGTPKRGDTTNSQKSQVSPGQVAPGSGSLHDMSFDNSPFLDYELDDGNFDWDINGEMVGALPGNDKEDSGSPEADGEGGDKRKSPEDENDEDGGGKRREGEDKNSKKPGRKPLTSEPTTKRKAQNRAAQRAFRERKEKHLKELETKVEDLEKASESANHENGLLRAQVERLQSELKEYRKRMSLTGTTSRTSPQTSSHSLSSKSNWDINNNFQFAFPKFGPLGTDPNNGTLNTSGRNNSFAASPTSATSAHQPAFNGPDDLSELFSPSVLASASTRSGSTERFPIANQSNANKGSISETNTASPCSSVSHSASQNGFNSSCATTPECAAESPEQCKASEAAAGTIAEDSQRRKSSSQEAFCKDFQTACGNKKNPVPPMISESNKSPASASSNHQPTTPGFDSNTIDWFANQNGGVFDPVLFGDYRDPQENIMNGDFGFFDNAFTMPADLNSESHTTPLETTLPKKKDLMQQIEDQQAGKEQEVVPGENPKQFLTCNMLWDRVQRSQKVQSGEADMDDLCSQLKSKAKCSGNGAVIEQKDVDAILGPAPDDTRNFFKMFK